MAKQLLNCQVVHCEVVQVGCETSPEGVPPFPVGPQLVTLVLMSEVGFIEWFLAVSAAPQQRNNRVI
jgi:hypothetical protein